MYGHNTAIKTNIKNIRPPIAAPLLLRSLKTFAFQYSYLLGHALLEFMFCLTSIFTLLVVRDRVTPLVCNINRQVYYEYTRPRCIKQFLNQWVISIKHRKSVIFLNLDSKDLFSNNGTPSCLPMKDRLLLMLEL